MGRLSALNVNNLKCQESVWLQRETSNLCIEIWSFFKHTRRGMIAQYNK